MYNLEYEDVLELLSQDSPSVRITYNSSHQESLELREWIRDNRITGITITPETRRFHPYNNLASHLLGFTRADGHGAIGLEFTLDELLSGTPRKYDNSYRWASKRITTAVGTL